MTVSRVFAIAVLALALHAAPALAQKAGRPEVKAGDHWQFVVYYTVPSTKPNRTWVINSVTSTEITGTENGEPLLLSPELNVLDSPLGKSSNPQELSFPLEVGKTWRYVNDWLFKPKGSKGRYVVEAKVIGYEKISVPAGEFDAFKLVSTSSVSGTSPIGSQYAGETLRTYWYAPAARAIVKSVTRNPYLGPSTVELVEMQLRP